MHRAYSTLLAERRANERSLATTDDPDTAFGFLLRLDAISRELDAKLDDAWGRAQSTLSEQPSAADIRRSIERGD